MYKIIILHALFPKGQSMPQYYLFHLYVMEYNRNDPATTKEQLRIIIKEQISTRIFLGGIKIHLLHVERIYELQQLNGCT